MQRDRQLRIISGKLKSRKLVSVPGRQTRPTSDRVREALFNILGQTPVGVNVLDLFAGTGALGIEALSRGADMAVFIDNSRNALNVLRKNISLCGLEASTKTIQWDIAGNLNCLQSFRNYFNLIFVDPPYMHGLVQPAITHLLHTQALAENALIVVEHSPDEVLDHEAVGLVAVDFRRYSKTAISMFKRRCQ